MILDRRQDRSILVCALVGALLATSGRSQNVGGRADREPATHDDLMARVADRDPAFGGAFVDPATGTLTLYSWNDTASGQAEAVDALRAVLGDQFAPGPVRVIHGNYGFRELKQWSDRLTGVLAMPGVVLTDIDDARNRLTVGVESAAAGWKVRDRLGALGIPGEAVDVVERPAFHLQVVTNLRSKVRPLVGGIQLGFSLNGSQYVCTNGFNAVRGGVAGEVINSHCSGVQGGVQGTIENQPASPSRIGVETVDPTYYTGNGCPVGKVCRRSDTAFVRRDAAVTATLGRIARPALGLVAWNLVDTFRIVKEVAPLVGQAVTKVGRTSGRTAGKVTAVCTNISVTGTNIVQLCQGLATLGSLGGDSGSPVFQILNKPAANDVGLAGILWGGDGAGISAFSPMSGIQRSTAPAELGPVTTCAAGFTC